jgi:hypothetical protein
VAASFLISPIHAEGEPPLQWRDGYINWRRQLVKPNWQAFAAGDGTKFAVDTDHINRKRHSVVFYLIGDDTYDPKRLIEFQFNCKDFADVVSAVDTATVKLVEKEAERMACDEE